MTIDILGYSVNVISLGAIVFIALFFYLIWRYKQGGMRITTGGGGTPVLNMYAQDLTALASKGELDPVIGRKKEIVRVIQILTRRRKNNPLLLGDPGVGKTAIAEGLARKIHEKKVPESLQDKRVLALDMTGLISGTKYRGEFEKRFKAILKEIELSNRTIILFIDEVHILTQSSGSEGAIDPADILKPALARGWLQMVGATTNLEYEQYIKKDLTLERRFQPVNIKEPSIEDTKTILKGVKDSYEKHHKVKYTEEALILAAELSARYIQGRFLPDKAIDVLDEAGSMVALQNASSRKEGQEVLVEAMHIKQIITAWTGKSEQEV